MVDAEGDEDEKPDPWAAVVKGYEPEAADRVKGSGGRPGDRFTRVAED